MTVNHESQRVQHDMSTALAASTDLTFFGMERAQVRPSQVP